MRKKPSETTNNKETGSPNTTRHELRNHLLGAYRSHQEQYNHDNSPQTNQMHEALKQSTTIELKLTTEEALVLNEYAKCCGESLPDLIRKALIRDATLADGYGPDDPQYEYGLRLANRDAHGRPLSAIAQRMLEEDMYNRLRSTLGWNKIKL